MTSYSELQEFRRCPQAWNYGYERGLESADSGSREVAVEFGHWWHAWRAVEAIERGRAAGTLRYAPEHLRPSDQRGYKMPTTSVTLQDLMEAATRYDREMTADTAELWKDTLGDTLVPRLTGLATAWRDRFGADTRNEEALGVEVKWTRALGSGEGAVHLTGRVDEVYRDRTRGLVVVRDIKCSKDLGTQNTADDMMDSQLQFYAWGISPLVGTWDVGRVQATSYDRARSVAPKPPQLTKSGRLAVRGGEPSVGQCDLATYLAWSAGPDGRGVPYAGLKADGSQAGLYVAEESVIEKLSTPAARSTWFQRTLTPLNSNLIRSHLSAAVSTATRLQAAREVVARTGEAERNMTRFTCRWCDFAELCRAELVGGVIGSDYELSDYRLQVRPGRQEQAPATATAGAR